MFGEGQDLPKPLPEMGWKGMFGEGQALPKPLPEMF